MASSGSTHDPARSARTPVPGPVAPLLQAHLARANGQLTLMLIGDIDVSTSATVRAVVRHCLRERPARLLLDMRSVGFCDVEGVRALQWARRATAGVPAAFGIIAPRPAVLRLFGLMHAGDLLAAAQGTGDGKGEVPEDAPAM